MGTGRQGQGPGKMKKREGIFMRLMNWIAEGAAKAQKGGGQCPT